MTLHAQKFVRATLRRLAPIINTRRRGSVVVFAVAALAVMAIAAVAYLTVVRIERSSAAAYSRVINFQQQVNAVVGETSGLLAADLFGNKVVTNATPRTIQGVGNEVIRISPRMFEDGGYLDFPQVHIGPNNGVTFNYQRRQPTQGDPFTLDPRSDTASRVAMPDDAWLASTTPIPPGFGAQLWSIWPQITNLRSAYRFNPDAGQFGLWVRDHGRYADLGQFWERATPDNRGNPGADLSPDMLDDNPDIGPAVYVDRNGPWAGIDQQVFNRIMGEMAQRPDISEVPRGGNYTPMDSRFWADTDGDGFPDARWQELDVLGELFGLRWVVAARITDNSALANVNAHIAGRDWLSPANASRFADGITPADVDLQRLLDRYWLPFQQGGAGHPDLHSYNAARLDIVFEEHLNTGIGATNIFEQIARRQPASEDIFSSFRGSLFHGPGADTTPTQDITPDYNQLNRPNLMMPVHREALWRGFGASPRRPIATSGVGYPLGDEVALRAFHGFNYESLVSKIEQRFDGPENGQPNFLPPRGEGPYPGQERIGLMRSKEPGSTHVWRLPSHPDPGAQPQGYAVFPNNRGRLERIQRDVRRLLTTIGGAGDHSPIPPVNRSVNALGQEIFGGRTSNRKIPLADINTESLDRRRELGQRAFEAFVWALAPMATDQPLGHGITASDVGDPFNYASRTDSHYGGGISGPATAMQSALNLTPEIGPAYALLRAASLTANLVAGSNPPADEGIYNATIARLYPRHQFPSQPGLTTAPLVQDNVIPLTMRFSHGDIGDALNPERLLIDIMPQELVGDNLHGVSLIGLQHQPYIVEATSFAAYTSRPDLTSGDPVPQTEPEVEDADAIANERIGAGFAFELRNPWPDPINLTPYHVRIANDNGFIQIGLDQVDTGGVTAAPVLQPGRSIILYIESESGFAGFDTIWAPIRDRWRDEIEARANAENSNVQQVARLEPSAILPGGDAVSGVFFQRLGQADAATVMLVATDTTNDIEVLVDRLAPPVGAMNFPATIVNASHEFFTPSGEPTRAGTARWSIASTLYRPTENTNTSGGFPGYVIERRENNQLEVSDEKILPWLMTPMGDPEWLPDPGPDWGDLFDMAFDGSTGGIDSLLGENKGAVDNLPPFQLFVPNGPLAYASELHMLSVYAHTYKHSVVNISMDTAHRAPRLTSPNADLGTIGANDDYWLTVGEQLGADWHMAYKADEAISGSNINPYLGVLDPTRFVLASNNPFVSPTGDLRVVEDLPDTLAMPLALRVFDPFDALSSTSALRNGRVNINTAPSDILDLIPFMTTGLQSPNPLENNNSIRRRIVENYRFDINNQIHTPGYYNHLDGPPDLQTYALMDGRRETMTRIPGMRNVDVNQKINGFVSTGELAVLDVWDTDGSFLPGNNARGFLELGKANVPSAPPFVMRDRVYNSQGDPEKRLGVFRAMSNIVTTRSDVFTMTFIIRGYDPEAIEAIRIDPNDPDSPNNPDEALDMLAPTFEQRWLAMFDRSNVRRPTDRPRVLLLVELPLDQAQVAGQN